MNLAETPAETLRPAHVLEIEPVGRSLLAARLSPVAQRAGARAAAPPAFMTFDAFCRRIDTLAAPGQLHLHGDEEPLLHPRVFDMVAYATRKGFEVSATTRLPGLTAKRAEECVESGLRRLHVRLAGAPAPLQARSLQRLEEAKRKLGSAFPEILVAGG